MAGRASSRRQRLRRTGVLQRSTGWRRSAAGDASCWSPARWRFDGRHHVASRPCRPGRPAGAAAGAGAGLAADRRAVAAPGGDGDGAGAGAAAGPARNGTIRRCCGARGWPGFAAALRAVQAPAERRRRRHPRRGWPMTSCWPGRWRWRWSARRVRAPRPGGALAGDGAAARPGAGRASAIRSPPRRRRRWPRSTPTSPPPRRMLRLLQGDVGSGKTLVALLAMLRAVEAGEQAALMAPTEVLARQHHRTLVAALPRAGRAADRRVKGARAHAAAARPGGRLGADRRRHPRAVPGGRWNIRDLGAGGDRRAAPLRRATSGCCWATRASRPTCW